MLKPLVIPLPTSSPALTTALTTGFLTILSTRIGGIRTGGIRIGGMGKRIGGIRIGGIRTGGIRILKNRLRLRPPKIPSVPLIRVSNRIIANKAEINRMMLLSAKNSQKELRLTSFLWQTFSVIFKFFHNDVFDTNFDSID